ncbi:T9SS type A sorting domain-containing protein [Aequorivita echinoideorum]|uniref:T9SS type A sorting domain-containing protein n=1 Tax=Aequorivita echinoideorum TaxID=1549647 RepID=A0ABS5S152_9FLAO|nr:T9SS type A sorting domain-containing protein [Aequorivita echinoideorum]MBT0606708.1 T9SS type A sorting domain-containing protein [Aequorivita echinoideorum]
MKKLIILFLCLISFSFQQIYAQLEITGSEEYGRIFDITYDASVPNKVYAVTLGNHIVVSEDNGASWQILYSLILGQGAEIRDLKLSADGTALTFSAFLPNTTVNAIMVYDIASASVIKTFALPNQSDLAYVSSYDFYDADMDVLLVDTNFPQGFNTEGRTFYTADGGANWDMIYYTTNNDTVFINDVAISPTDPNKLFLTRGNGSTGVDGGLFISVDGGQNFTEKLPGIILDPITFDPLNAQNIYIGTGISFGGTVENLYKSTDGGATFNIVPITWTEGILDNITVIKINDNNPSQLIVLEENEIAISEDGGATFQNIVYPNVDDSENYYYGLNASYNPQNSDEIFISANYIPLFSNDGGETLTWSKTPYFTSTGNMDIFRNGSEENLYYGVQFGYVHRDLDTGTETPYDIVPLSTFSNNPGQTQYADQITPNRIFKFTSSFMGSSLVLSNDNGATETQLLSIFANRFTSVATFPSAPQTIFAAFGGFDPSETILKKIDFSDINNIVETTLNLPTLNYINGILIDSSDKITIAVGTDVYVSTDGGSTWAENSTGLEAMTANDLIFDLTQDPLNTDRLALASSKGIYISENGGQNWDRKTTSLVYNVAFSTETEGAMMASTYSSQVSEFALHFSTNNGENWQTINNEQLLGIGSAASQYYFNENSAVAYIGSFDLGLIEYTIDLTPLGTPDLQAGLNSISIYPNPASDILNIGVKDSHVMQTTIFAMNGAQVMTANAVSTLNISALERGVYLVRIRTNKNEVFFKRIIKE